MSDRDLRQRARDALRRLHEQGRIASPWKDGMMMLESTATGELWAIDRYCLVEPVDASARLPDPHDPATLGCLLALLREATGDARAWLQPQGSMWTCAVRGLERPGRLDMAGGETEAGAIVAALEAVADDHS